MSEVTDKPQVDLFTDGACLGNPGPGGWAYVLRHPGSGKVKEAVGGSGRTTNNRMEITAVIRGLEALQQPSGVTLCSDSKYLLNGISEWMAGWKARGWKRKGNRPVLNIELWQQLDELVQKHDVKTVWVRGHAGHPENERCDQLASEEAQRIADGDEGEVDTGAEEEEWFEV